MNITNISLIDLLLSVAVITLIIIFANLFKPKSKQSGNQYYFPFVYAKIFFAIAFVLIHVYYYRGGDTFLYFSGANFFADQIISSPINALKLYFTTQENLGNIHYSSNYIYALNSSEDVFLMSKIVGLFSFLMANQYLATSILYTSITSIGLWKLFQVFCKLYPRLDKYFAFGILFYPSLGIWGSGILKDPLTLCCVGLIFWSCYNILNNRKHILSIVLMLMSVYFCFILKPYILYTFIPIMGLWMQSQISNKFKNPVIKIIITPILIAGFGFGSYFAINSVSSGAGKYSLDSAQEVAEGFHSWHTYLAETRDQSGYSLGEVEFTLQGILRKAPEGFFVTYYRPFIIGDVRNIATFFEAIQTFILLVLTFLIIFRVGILKFFKYILADPDVRAFMLFAVFFGIAVGLTSYNFGALSRYKIPSLPFYIAALAIIYYKGYLVQKKGIKD